MFTSAVIAEGTTITPYAPSDALRFPPAEGVGGAPLAEGGGGAAPPPLFAAARDLSSCSISCLLRLLKLSRICVTSGKDEADGASSTDLREPATDARRRA